MKVFEARVKGQESVGASRRSTDTETPERWEHFVSADAFNVIIMIVICWVFFFFFLQYIKVPYDAKVT